MSIYKNDVLLSKFYYACKKGLIKVAKLIIEILDSIDISNIYKLYIFDRGLRNASEYGHIEIINLMLEQKLVKSTIFKYSDMLNHGLIYASKNGHVEIVKLLVEKGAYNFDSGLLYACVRGNLEIFNLMLEKGANISDDLFVLACKGPNLEIINFILKNRENIGIKIEIEELNDGFENACKGGNINVVQLMLV